ncbi:NADH-quinone oxidoreductase chain M [Komagataeibacter oboediens DSM 11826]|uniref:NADH-quinone oxidoreductase subunit M n=1 Tax=Komagataeibacter oboediens TaxID=65958 RepID=A0A318QRH6_9PROT|nr:NADH-quinone oxidoreductase subunit M [Komagataeibacter oboediens]PYD81625.1 NADH-quinone oxidoreductase subunit M [Komagataeibacter oboediens]GBR27265.1 NADH-quinone oxidoreductase chain M [Komagataeibacter oboediens DSM 11826]
MIALPALVLLPVLGGGVAWVAGRIRPVPTPASRDAAWWVALVTLGMETLLLALITFGHQPHAGPWLAHFSMPWIPAMGIAIRLDMDGLSLSLIWLSLVLCFPCVFLSTRQVTVNAGAFHFLFLATLAGIIGTFLATDLFLFFFFWELMLVPMFVLIAAWGHEDRQRAAMTFFMFTQGSGLIMLVSILGLVMAHYRATGVLTFDYVTLSRTPLSPALSMLIMVGFFVAFAVKLPVVPVHVWLPAAHTQAPTAASVLLAGILLKTGGYGMIRFDVMLFPDAASRFAPVAMGMGVVGILYGAWMSCAQDDVKRLIAYSSVSHMGFVLTGIFCGSRMGMQGAIMQMLAHGLSTAALFVIAGAIQDRLHTRDMRRIGGLWAAMPRLSSAGVFFAVAALGMPGLGNFTGEFLVLLATWHVSPALATVAAAGLVPAAMYALRMVNRIFLAAPRVGQSPGPDFPPRQMAVLACVMALVAVLGLYPQPFMAFSLPLPVAAMTGGKDGAP